MSNKYVHNVFISNTGGTLTDLAATNSSFTNMGRRSTRGRVPNGLTTGGLAGTPTATVHATHNTFHGNLSSTVDIHRHRVLGAA